MKHQTNFIKRNFLYLLLLLFIINTSWAEDTYYRCCYHYPKGVNIFTNELSCDKNFNDSDFNLSNLVLASSDDYALRLCDAYFTRSSFPFNLKEGVIKANEMDLIQFKNSFIDNSELKDLISSKEEIEKLKTLIDKKIDLGSAVRFKKSIPKASIEDIIKMSSIHINFNSAADFLESNPDFSLDDLIFLHENKINFFIANEFLKLFPELTAHELNKLKEIGLDLDYEAKLKRNFPELTLNEIIELHKSSFPISFCIDLKQYITQATIKDCEILAKYNNDEPYLYKVVMNSFPGLTVSDLISYIEKGAQLANIYNLSLVFPKFKIDDEIISISKNQALVNSILSIKSSLDKYLSISIEEAKSIAMASLIQGNLQTQQPPSTIKNISNLLHVEGPKTEVVKLAKDKTRVLIADYELLRRDFPSLKNLSNSEIDQWLISEFAYIAQTQTQTHKISVNSEIPLERENGEIIKKKAYRPDGYGRALILPLTETKIKPGLIDAKGVGAVKPSSGHHSNGLATLGELIREYLYQKLVQEILDHAGIPNRTVESYAVISAGFNVIHFDVAGKPVDQSPAGIILRQAHKRLNGGGFLDQESISKFEKFFAHYGIDIEENIQGSTFENVHCTGVDELSSKTITLPLVTLVNKIVDFGHYVTKTEHQLNYDRAKYKNLSPLLRKHCVPSHVWGYDSCNQLHEGETEETHKHQRPSEYWVHAIDDRASQFSSETAKACINLDPDQCKRVMENHFQTMLKEFRENLAAHPINIEDLIEDKLIPLPKDIVKLKSEYHKIYGHDLPTKPIITNSALDHVKGKLRTK